MSVAKLGDSIELLLGLLRLFTACSFGFSSAFGVGCCHEAAGFEAKAVEADEACGVVLVVGIGGVCLHGGDVGTIEAKRALPASGMDAAFVELEAHGAGDILLAFAYEGLEGLALGRIPEAVVEYPSIPAPMPGA